MQRSAHYEKTEASMSIAAFLSEPGNTHAREELLNYRLLFDMKLAAAGRGYHLLTYYSDVDHDGFDVIFDDRDRLIKVQLKTVAVDSSTTSCVVHKSLIRPEVRNWETFGLVPGPSPGVEGGVVLMEYIAGDGTMDIAYYYTDIYIIALRMLGILSTRTETRRAAADLMAALQDGKSADKLSVARGLFVAAASPMNLLALMGLHSSHDYNWKMQAIWAIRAEQKLGAEGELPAPPDVLRQTVVESLLRAAGPNA
jgi:hypothetical protein